MPAPRVPVRPSPARSPGERPGCTSSSRLLTHRGSRVVGAGLIFPSHLHIPIYKGYPRPSLSNGVGGGGRRGRWKYSLTLFLHLPFLLRFLEHTGEFPFSTEHMDSLPSGLRGPRSRTPAWPLTVPLQQKGPRARLENARPPQTIARKTTGAARGETGAHRPAQTMMPPPAHLSIYFIKFFFFSSGAHSSTLAPGGKRAGGVRGRAPCTPRCRAPPTPRAPPACGRTRTGARLPRREFSHWAAPLPSRPATGAPLPRPRPAAARCRPRHAPLARGSVGHTRWPRPRRAWPEERPQARGGSAGQGGCALGGDRAVTSCTGTRPRLAAPLEAFRARQWTQPCTAARPGAAGPAGG